MRHLTFAFFTFFFGAFLFAGEISKTYQFSEYNIEQAGEYQFIHFENCMNTGHTGAPSLPWFAVKLLLPPGEKVVSFTISAQKEESIAGTYTIYPQQPSRPLSLGRGEHFQMDEKVYSSAIAYPKKASGIITTEYMNGYSIAMLNICPVQYIPSEGRLSYYSEITVNITTEKAREAETALTLLSSSEKVLGTLGKFVQNPKMLSEYPVRKSRTDDYELLIITPQAFENEFDALTDLYFIRGLKSEVTTSEEISSTMNGQDMQEKIRNYIIQEVQSHNVEFVLLGGDVEH
ncbi:MAG: C25 family peptidase propeptide domain-containing protein, partial [Bacteroidota bacterium]